MEYFAIAIKDSIDKEYDIPCIKKGTIQSLTLKEAKQAKASGYAEFEYTSNMHYQSTKVECKVYKIVTIVKEF